MYYIRRILRGSSARPAAARVPIILDDVEKCLTKKEIQSDNTLKARLRVLRSS